MSERADSFRSMIANDAFIESEKLQEIDSRGKLIMDLGLKCRDIDAHYLFRFDPNKKDWFPFFSNSIKDLRSICDFFLLVERGDILYFLIIELKNSSKGKANEQLKASCVFAKYLIASANRVINDFGEPRIIKVRIVGGKPNTSFRQPSYENGTDYISYRFPCFFDVKSVLDVYTDNS